MPRNQDYDREQGRNDYNRSDSRSRSSNRDNSDRKVDNDYENSRYEKDRYEDTRENYSDNYGARSRGQMRGSRRDSMDREDRPSRQGQFSQRENRYRQGGEDYYEAADRDTSSGGGYGLGRDQFSQHQYDEEDSSAPIRDPYSRGGRVYSQGRDRGMGAQDYERESRPREDYGRSRFDSGNRYSEGGGRYDRTEDSYYADNRERYGRNISRDGHYRDQERDSSGSSSRSSRPQMDSDRNESRSFGGAYSGNDEMFGTDRGQNPRGQGRYGSSGSSGARRSNNNYLDESDDNYKYAYGSDNEEWRHSRGVHQDNERSISPGRARYSHGEEMNEDLDEAHDADSFDRGTTAQLNRPTKGSKTSNAKKAAKTAKSENSKTSTLSASAKSKTGKGSNKGNQKSVVDSDHSSDSAQ